METTLPTPYLSVVVFVHGAIMKAGPSPGSTQCPWRPQSLSLPTSRSGSLSGSLSDSFCCSLTSALLLLPLSFLPLRLLFKSPPCLFTSNCNAFHHWCLRLKPPKVPCSDVYWVNVTTTFWQKKHSARHFLGRALKRTQKSPKLNASKQKFQICS